MRSALVLAVGLLGLACGEIVLAPLPVDAEFLVARFGANPELAGAAAVPVASVVNDALVVLGAVGAGSPCHDVRGSMRARDRDITVTVTLEEQPGACVAVVASWQYRVARALPPGSYRVRVVHQWVGGEAVVALETIVGVP